MINNTGYNLRFECESVYDFIRADSSTAEFPGVASRCLSNSLRRRIVTNKFTLALANDKLVYIKATSLPALLPTKLAASLALSCKATVNVSKNANLPAVTIER